MRLPSRIARTSALVLTLSAAAASQGAAGGGPPARIVFPIVGEASFSDDFGDARGQGRHEGNDILAERHAPVVAVEDGRIRFWTTSASAGCMLYLYGESGTTYYYIHLNNDVGDGNDNRGSCVPGTAYAPGLSDGETVEAGQLVGFVGDSGDADGLHPHLHFELHPGDGAAVSPYRALRRAYRLVYAARPTLPAKASLAVRGRLKAVSAKGRKVEIVVAAQRSALSTGRSFVLDRDIVFRVPPRADVRRRLGGTTVRASLGRARPGEDVTVTVTVARKALSSQIARPGALRASRVVLSAGA